MPYLETVQELLEAKEGEHVQFKEAKKQFDSREAAKCCCALANNGGGKLVFGITDKRPRSVVGSAAFDQPERTRMGLIEKLKVNVDFQLFNYEGKRVLVFDVKSRPIGLPVQYDGVAWIYEGDTLKPMPEDMRRSIYDETGGDFSGTICAGATVDDLDETAIENFRAKWIEKSGKKQLATLSKNQLLQDCGAITDDGVTYAALILFGKNAAITKYLPQAEIIFEYRSSEASGPANQREEFKVGFFACYDRVWELVNLRNDKQHYLTIAEQGGGETEEQLTYQIQTITQRKEDALDAFFAETITKEEMRLMNGCYDKELTQLQSRLSAVRERDKLSYETATLQADIKRHISNLLHTKNPDEVFYKNILEQIVVDPERHLTIKLNLLPPKWKYVLDSVCDIRRHLQEQPFRSHVDPFPPISVSRPFSSG